MVITNLPLRFRKAGRLWCGGARETPRATAYNELRFQFGRAGPLRPEIWLGQAGPEDLQPW